MEALIGHLPRTHTQLYSDLSNKLNGRNVNWFPNGKSLATTVAESVEVSIYGIKPSSVPTESIPGGFGYGTLFVVGGRGDEGYGYGYAIYNGSNATGSRIFATYDKDSGWSECVSKSDLQSFLMYKEFTTETRDWTPLTSYRISHTTPSGYRFLAYCHTRTNGWVGSVHPTPININEMSDLWTSVGSGTGTVTIGILFVKSV